MVDFRVMASSSAGNAYLLSCPSAHGPLLLDAGLRFQDIQEATGFRVTNLAGCLLTHAHGDHSKAVKGLLGYGVEVFASRAAWSELDLPPHASKREAFSKCEITVGGWKVLPFDAVHDSPGTLGYLILSPEGDTFLYLTDSCYSPFRFDGVTHMAVECNHSVEILRKLAQSGQIDRERYHRTIQNHMSIERLVQMLRANDLRHLEAVWLLHLSDEGSDAEAFKREVQRVVGVPVYVAGKNTLCIESASGAKA